MDKKVSNVPSKSRVLTDKLADFASFFLIDAYLRLANCTTKCVVAHCEQYNKVPADVGAIHKRRQNILEGKGSLKF